MADYTYTATPLGSAALYGLDTFQGAAGTRVDLRSPDVGASWSQVYNQGGLNSLKLNGAGLLLPANSNPQIYVKQDSLPGPDYDVWVTALDQVDAVGGGAAANALAVARYDIGTGRAYVAGFTTSGHLSRPSYGIYLWSGGTLTPIGVPVLASFTRGQRYTCRFMLRGTLLTLIMHDGTTIAAVDTTLSAAGSAGIFASNDAFDGTAGYYFSGFRLTYADPATVLGAASGDANATGAVLPAPGGLPAAAVRLDWNFRTSPQAAPGAVVFGGASFDIVRQVAPLGGGVLPAPAVSGTSLLSGVWVGTAGTLPAPRLSYGVLAAPGPLATGGAVTSWGVAIDAVARPAPLVGSGTLTTAALTTISTMIVTPLAGAGVVIGGAAGSAGIVATSLVGSGTLPAATPSGSVSIRPVLAAPGALPAPSVGSGVGLSVVLAAPGVLPAPAVGGGVRLSVVLAAPGALPTVATSFDQSFRIAPLAAPGVLIAASTRVDATFQSVLAAPGVLLAALSADVSAGRYVLAATGTLPAAAPRVDVTYVVAPLVGLGTVLYGGLSTDADFSTTIIPLAYDPHLVSPTLLLDWTVPVSPLATVGTLVDLNSGVGTSPAITPLVGDGTLPAVTVKTSVSVPLGIAALRLRAPTFVTLSTDGLYDGQAWHQLGPDADGSDYPLIEPSDDVRHLIADAALVFRGVAYDPPLRVAWVAGLGNLFLGTEGLPIPPPTPPDPTLPSFAPTHLCDVAIVDAGGAIVFDSTAADDYAGEQYGPYLFAHRWSGPDAALYLTQRIKFPRAELGFQVPNTLWPASARLCERVGEVACPQVTSLNDIADRVTLVPGYNIALPYAGPAVSGVERVSTVTIDCIPGAGLGRYPDCADGAATPLAYAGTAAANAIGDLAVAGDGCYHVRPVVSINSGRATLADGVLQFGNDCRPCCSCSDYVDLATALSDLWTQLRAIGLDAEAVRAQLAAGHDRWRQLEVPGAVPLRVRMAGLCHNFRYVDLAVQACYVGDECRTFLGVNLTIHIDGGPPALTFRPLADDCFISSVCPQVDRSTVYLLGDPDMPTNRSFITIAAKRWTQGDAAYEMMLLWDKVQPRSTATARIRFVFGKLDKRVMTTMRVDASPSDQGTVGIPIVTVS